MSKKWFTLRETAEALGVSEVTCRRYIKQEKIKAELQPGPYGEQYMIPASEISVPLEIKDVVTVSRETDLLELAKVLNSYLDGQEEKFEALEEEMRALREEIKKQNELLQDRDLQLMQAIRKLQEEHQKPWWKKIFG